ALQSGRGVARGSPTARRSRGMTPKPTDTSALLPIILALHEKIRDAVVVACERQSIESLSAVAAEEAGDTIYAVDKVSEELLVHELGQIAVRIPLVLIAEGIEGGKVVLPHGTNED